MDLNLIPFYAEALAHSEKIRRDINNIYSKKKEDYYIAAKSSEYYECTMCKENSLLTEEYFKKCLGLLEYAAKNPDEETLAGIYDLFKKAFRKTYLYFKNIKTEDCDIKDYMKDMAHNFEKLDDDTINGNIAAAVFFTQGNCKNLDIIIDILSLRWNHYNGYRRISLNNISEQDEKEINRKYQDVPKNIINEELAMSNKRALSVYDYIYDIEGISSLSIFRELEFSKNDIREIILAYIAGEKNSDDRIAFDKTFLIPALHLKAMCKAYKKVKDMYFKNNKETMYVEMGSLKKELFRVQSELKLQEEKNKQYIQAESDRNVDLIKENAQLQKQIEELKEELNQTKSNEKEVIALRDFIFNMSMKSFDESSVNTGDVFDLNALQGIKGMIIGGHDNWQNRIKEYIPPSWKMVKAGVNTLEIEAIHNCDVVIFNTGYLNHSLYNKVIDMTRSMKIKIGYIQSTNMNKALQEILDICNK